ncbi:phage portal protein [Sphingomonas sp.]|uniref:phage portal protein n=1 Tax=Sphingomonas sp. TaxID=28214 RepID=UPI0031D161F7
MKWFGKRREASRPALARAYGMAGGLGEWPQSYEAQVREGYAANPVAQRAVKIVAEGVAAAPVAASDLALHKLVAARSQGQELTGTLAAQLLLHGNAFVQVLGDGAGGVAELFALRPERVSVETDAGGWPAAYRYRVGGSVSRIAAEDASGNPQVIHLKAFSPVDDHYGLGCLGAASGAVAIHNAATRWNKALLDNAARPSGALVYDPGDGSALSPAQFERLKADMEAAFAGAANAGRPMLFEGGLRWQALSLSPADMDFVGLKAAAAREIALAFGVPPMLIGLPGDNSYANYREANRAVWRLTILPLAEKILTELAQGLAGWFPEASLRVEIDKVPAMAEDRERLWRSVSAAEFLTTDEKRVMLGLEGPGPEGGAA